MSERKLFSQVDREPYKTRKEYRFAKKKAKRQDHPIVITNGVSRHCFGYIDG